MRAWPASGLNALCLRCLLMPGRVERVEGLAIPAPAPSISTP